MVTLDVLPPSHKVGSFWDSKREECANANKPKEIRIEAAMMLPFFEWENFNRIVYLSAYVVVF